MVSHLAVSASVPGMWLTQRVSQEVGYDAGKNVKGRKRFLTVDTFSKSQSFLEALPRKPLSKTLVSQQTTSS
ncbi:hypothetical protein CAL7716_100030 (plasmid) [Calothrix sp. PCC 7716]|nr:hypothetical protein CAL7716_100030 [Calothrix sp. PCC 7716]